MSPLRLSGRIRDAEIARVYTATRDTLMLWRRRLLEETGQGFSGVVTVFRPDLAAHGEFGHPRPVCTSPVQRIRYVDNETNYCARCQAGGRLLADRARSRLLKGDWPRSPDDLDA